jgi:hypothetical protein
VTEYDTALNHDEGERLHMPINSRYVFIASMDVDSDKEDLFNEIYDTERVANLLKVPGVRAATRVKESLSN